MEQLNFLSPDAHAKASQSLDSEKDWLTLAETSHSTFLKFLMRYGPVGFCMRTSPASYPAGQMRRRVKRSPMTREEIETSLGDLSDLTEEGAAEIETKSWSRQTILTPSSVDFGNSGTVSRGESLTLSILEFPSDAVASLLSDILETGALPQRFFLSATACQGILRRAARRGKELLPRLAHALKQVAASAQTPNSVEP